VGIPRPSQAVNVEAVPFVREELISWSKAGIIKRSDELTPSEAQRFQLKDLGGN